MNNFTTSEYIAKHELGVSPHDPTATRLIAASLKAKGYRRRRVKRNGTFQQIWTNDPETDYSYLTERLNAL